MSHMVKGDAYVPMGVKGLSTQKKLDQAGCKSQTETNKLLDRIRIFQDNDEELHVHIGNPGMII